MSRALAGWLSCSLGLACGSVVQLEDGSGGATSSAVDGSATSSGSGGGFDYAFDETWTELQCADEEFGTSSNLWVEIYPGNHDGACTPPIDISPELLIVFVKDWDGASGTFDISADGPARVVHALASPGEMSSGTVRVDVSAQWAPSALTVDVKFDSGDAESFTADIGRCVGSEPRDPCER